MKSAKVDLDQAVESQISTSQTTTSTSFTDLATPGPAVTTTISQSGRALVIVSGMLKNSGLAFTRMSYAVSGASTVAASDTNGISVVNTNEIEASRSSLVTGLTPGSNTFTAKYRVTGGTGTFTSRSITVIPL